ncbi:MAG: FKBP-type peptidyl-prolyl cis-trans isomerase [Actinomycetota bacterium]
MQPARFRFVWCSIVMATLALTGCAQDTSSTSPSSANPLQEVEVSGSIGQKPTVKISTTPLSLTESKVRVITAGKGAKITKGQRVTFDYQVVNARTGAEVATSFGQKPVVAIADPERLMIGLANSLIGQQVGSRVVAGITPKEAFGSSGDPQRQIQADDTIVVVFDVLDASNPLTKATGDPVPAKTGLPAVKDNGDKAPTITMPSGKPPTKTVVQLLIKGKGKKLESGQTVSAAYVGALYGSGKVFDSSYKSGQLLEVPIGVGGLVPGMDKNLVGQTVGSRVLLIIPPKDGYGSAGQPTAGIKGTDTLVFVVDILDGF